MKNPKLKIRKKVRVSSFRKLKLAIGEAVGDCLEDILPYIVKDVVYVLQKKGMIYVQKNKKKNKKKKKKR